MIRGALVALLLLNASHLSPSTSPPAVGFDDFLVARASAHQIPLSLVRGMIRVESAGNPDAVGKRGEMGLLQLKIGTAREALSNPALTKNDLRNPRVNVEAGLRYLSRLRDRFGDLRVALVAYNAGPNRVASMRARGETLPRSYVQKIDAFIIYEHGK